MAQTIRVLSKQEFRAEESAERFEALKRLGAGDGHTGGSSGFVVEQTAASLLGITPRSLRAIGLPARQVPNPNYRSGPKCRLYDPRDLIRVADDERVVKARSRKNPVRRSYRGVMLN